ncbi:helix-turn-helix transcriptional regulator [Enterobacteriaceae bacterium LUAb1]
MFNIMIESDNLFYRYGLQALIDQALTGDRGFKYSFVFSKNIEMVNKVKVNVMFTELLVSINIPHKKNNKSNEDGEFLIEKINVSFNSNHLDVYEIVSRIKKIFKVACLAFNKLMNKDAGRMPGIKNYLQLSLTESKVLQLIGYGYNTTDISKILHCSEKTIGTHRRNAIRKLGMSNRVEFYKYATQIKDSNCRETVFICL